MKTFQRYLSSVNKGNVLEFPAGDVDYSLAKFFFYWANSPRLKRIFWGNVWHGINSLQNPAFFQILAFSWIYEVPTIVIGNTTDHYDLLNSLKENGGLILKPKQSAQRSISASVIAVSPRFSYFWKITPYALKRHRVKGCFCKVFGGNHAHSCIMGNQGKMAGNSKICFEIQSQLLLPEFIYLMLFMWKEYLTSSKKPHLKSGVQEVCDQFHFSIHFLQFWYFRITENVWEYHEHHGIS